MKGYSILVLVGIIFFLSVLTLLLPSESVEIAAQKIEEQQVVATTPKSELEVKIEAVKDGIDLTAQLIYEGKEKKRKQDSTYLASREERWVFQIGDWTDDERKIIESYERLRIFGNIKLLKQRKKYIFIKEDFLGKEDLVNSLDSMKAAFPGLSINVLDVNTFKDRKQEIVTRSEKFRKGGNKATIDCLTVVKK